MTPSTFLLGQLFNGLSYCSILLLIALGLAITFGLMGVINMAHGELMRSEERRVGKECRL